MEAGQNTTAGSGLTVSGGNLEIIRKQWWKIGLFSLVIGAATLIMMFRLPDIYRASTIITPAVEENKPNLALGALASIGLAVGGPSKVEDLETLFKSNDLTVRVFRKYNLWEIVIPDRYDSQTGMLRVSWSERLLGQRTNARAPVDWDAIRAVQERLKVAVNKRSNTIFLSFDSPSPDGSERIVNCYLQEGKSRLQEEAFDRATRNKKFIEEQIAKTFDPLTKDRLYSLYGQEVEREMLARNREQFGFRVVDAPRAPDRKLKPRRAVGAVAATLLSIFIGCGYLLVRRPEKL